MKRQQISDLNFFVVLSEQVFLQILGVIAVSVSVIPWILIPVVPLLLVFLYLRRYFLQTSRNIKRLESTSECPTMCASRLHRYHVQYACWVLVKLVALSLFFIFPAARSPVFSHLSSSLQGLWTIRAFGAEERFQKAFDAHQDLHSGSPQFQHFFD